MYADNLLEIADQLRGMVEHGQALDELDIDVDITLGRAKAGVRTETQANAIGTIAKKMTDSKIGGWISGMMGAATTETAIASALSVVYSVGALAGQRVASSRLLAAASFGGTAVLAGGIAAWRERRQLDRERRLHARERAKSAKFVEGRDKRREEMEGLIYETRNAGDLAADLESMLFEPDEYGNNRERDLSHAETDRVVALMTDIDARIAISDRHKLDLLSYNSAETVEQERLRLDILRAQAKVRLRLLGDAEEIRSDLERIRCQREALLVSGDIKTKNTLFNKMRRKKTAKAFVKGVVIGATIGAAVQEVGAAFSDKHGIVDMFRGKGPVQGETMTGLAYLKHWMSGELPTVDGTFVDHVAGHDFKIPEGMNLEANPDGTLTLFADGNEIASGLEVDSAGMFTDASGDELAKHGIHLSEASVAVDKVRMVAGNMDASDWVNQNAGDMHEVSRDLWYGNDTPMYTDPLTGNLLGADHNELRLLWGGEGSTGIDADGNFVFDVGEMTKDGSWQGVYSADAQQLLQEGKMRLLLSVNDATQNRVFEVTVGVDGKAVIDKGSLVAKALFDEQGGKAKFLGRFAEVAQVTHTDDAGVDHVRMLATHVGNGIKEFTGEVPQVTEALDFITALDVPSSVDVLPPPVIPIWGRRSLERMRMAENGTPPPPYYMYETVLPEERRRQFEERRSPEFLQNPDVTLDPLKEAKRYLDSLSKEEREQVVRIAKKIDPLNEKVEISVCIPVAGHQEENNIYRSLESYTFQSLPKDSFEIVLLVNHPNVDKNGKKIVPDNTLKEIERFKQDYPDMPVKVIYEVIPIKDAKIGKIRKLLSDAVIQRQFMRGIDKDLIMVSNDADNYGVAPEYLQNFVQRFAEHPDVDGMLGQLDWDPGTYVHEPLIHVGTRLFQYLGIIGRHRSGGMVSSGANFAYKSSIYAGIGGYLSELPGGEDVAVGQAIIAARGKKEAMRFAGARSSRLYTSARRAINALHKGLSPVEQWDMGFSAFDDEIRKLQQTLGIMPHYESPDYLQKLKLGLERVIDRTVSVYERGEVLGKEAWMYKKALGWLGVKYEVQNGKIVITDMTRLIEGLNRYQQDGILMRDAKSGKPGAEQILKVQRLERRIVELQDTLHREREDVEEANKIAQRHAKIEGQGDLRVPMNRDMSAFDSVMNADRRDLASVGSFHYDTKNPFLFYGTSRVYPGKDKDDKPVVVKFAGVDQYVPMETGDAKGETIESYLAKKGFHSANVSLPRLIHVDATKGEYVRVYDDLGVDLETRFAEASSYETKDALRVMIQVCKGAMDLHALGIVHGDIAPSNILLNERGATLIDLDDSRVRTQTGFYVDADRMRLNRFIQPPEVVRRPPAVYKENIDVYQAGATLYRLLVGQWPYIDKEIERQPMTNEEKMFAYKKMHEKGEITFPDTVPERLQVLIIKAMDPNPNTRYQHMYEFLEGMMDVLEAPPASP